MKMNKEKILEELKREERSIAWLSRKLGISQQAFAHHLNKETVKYVEDISKILKIKTTDLLVFNGEIKDSN
jgi:DNA-binding transcriptional ArsR family regulator